MRLLVIEDNRSLVANLFDYFEARGHTLDAAPDGLTGLHLASTQTYDAIVLDWMLPRLEGPEVLRRLREDHGSDVPVIMLTARDELPDQVHIETVTRYRIDAATGVIRWMESVETKRILANEDVNRTTMTLRAVPAPAEDAP